MPMPLYPYYALSLRDIFVNAYRLAILSLVSASVYFILKFFGLVGMAKVLPDMLISSELLDSLI